MTAKEFAADIGVNANSLQHWGWKLSAEQRRERKERTEPLEWVEVAAPAKEVAAPATGPFPTAMFELVLASGMTVRVPERFDEVALRRLLDAVTG